jgi:hypothetical protein
MNVNRRALIAAGLALPSLALAGCDGAIFPHMRRFLLKLTVAVEGVDRIGTSVFETHYGRSYMEGFDSSPYYWSAAWAQAPFVTVEGSIAVFALLTPPQLMKGFNFHNFTSNLAAYASPELRLGTLAFFKYVMDLEGEHEVSPENFPVMIYFENPREFLSARQLPSGGALVAGKEVHFRKLTLTLTDQPVTHKLSSEVLPTFDGASVHPNYMQGVTQPMADVPFVGLLVSQNFTQNGEP